MSLFRAPTARQLDVGLTILRVTLGAVFLAHGGQKLFVYGFPGVSGAFGQMGIPLPGLIGPAVALLEFAGGLALIAGLLTRLAALGLALNMVGAIVFVHMGSGFFLPNGSEFALSLLGSSALLVFTGGGNASLDGLIARRGVEEPAAVDRQVSLDARRAA